MMPEPWPSMRSIAKWVLPVLVGPRTAVIRPRELETMAQDLAANQLLCKRRGGKRPALERKRACRAAVRPARSPLSE